MATTPIDSGKIAENYFTNLSTRDKSTLGKDDFLNLLVTQLQYQDPLKPMEDKEFIGQMAQFSSLEQMQNMNAGFSSVKAFGMIGKEITAQVKNTETGKVEEVVGTADSVKMSGGKNYVVVNGQDIAIDDITNVTDTSATRNTEKITDYTGVIGKNVTAMFIDGETYGTLDMTGDVDSLNLISNSVYAVMNNVNTLVKNVEYTDEEELEYAGKDLKTYLTDKKQSGEEITAVFNTKDSDGNAIKIKVKGKVKDIQVDDEGNITSTVLDYVRIPAANIHQIR